MSALSEALLAAQRAAVNALATDYVRGSDEPDHDVIVANLRAVGLEDARETDQLLQAWSILRQTGAKPPTATPTPESRRADSEQTAVDGELRWTSGKHKGELLSETPADYLEWAAESHPDPIGRARSKEELERRAGVPF